MTIHRPILAALLITSPILSAQRQTRSVERLADGVYAVIYSEMKTDPVQSNSLIIIGDDGVCVVDAHYTPSAARLDIATIRQLTKLPVRYVVTTHWHDDHIFGNQEYRKAFPGVTFVAHRETRRSMENKALEHQQQLVAHYTKVVTRIERLVATGVNSKGDTVSASDLAEWKVILPMDREFLADVKTVKVVLPTLTFDSSLTLFLGQREIRVLNFGYANTRGDAAIYLPKEKITAIGDLVVYPVPFIFGGYPVAWGKAMQAVKSLGPAVMVPGHGPVLRDFTYFDQVSALMSALGTQASQAVSRGLDIDSTRKIMELKSIHDAMVQGDEGRDQSWQASVMQAGVEAAWQEAKGVEQED